MTLTPLAVLAATLFACSTASAQEAASSHALWITTGFATYHFDSDVVLNGRNPGVGLEYRFSDTMAVSAGRFYNSDFAHSRYVGLHYLPWQYKGVRFGAVVGAFDGYPKMRDGGWFPALIPAISYEYQRVGVNVAVVPNYKDRLYGGISVQLKFKLWD